MAHKEKLRGKKNKFQKRLPIYLYFILILSLIFVASLLYFSVTYKRPIRPTPLISKANKSIPIYVRQYS
ncbi:MAG: hypothetical protein WAW92_03210, partial [Minisyncoccia bacterium]